MKPSFGHLRGRVLVVGEKESAAKLLETLSGSGYFCAAADGADNVLSAAAKLKPEAILLSAPATEAGEALEIIRASEALRDIPVLADLSRARSEGLRKLSVEDFVNTHDELPRRLEAAMRARRLLAREKIGRAHV